MVTPIRVHAPAPSGPRLACAPPPIRGALALAMMALLSGCAGFSPDGGLAGVNDIVAPALGQEVQAIRTAEDAASAEARVQTMLRRPLSADRAATIALLNNRALQAAYNAL